jgi:hypothetical protein
MKIDGPGSVGPTAPSRRARKTGDSGKKFAQELSSGDADTGVSGVSSSGPLASVDALLALQEVPDSTQGRSRGLKRASDLLDRLDDIRNGLLIGSIPFDKLDRLVSLVRSQRADTTDPRLAALLDEIELRASVELAKLGRFA